MSKTLDTLEVALKNANTGYANEVGEHVIFCGTANCAEALIKAAENWAVIMRVGGAKPHGEE